MQRVREVQVGEFGVRSGVPFANGGGRRLRVQTVEGEERRQGDRGLAAGFAVRYDVDAESVGAEVPVGEAAAGTGRHGVVVDGRW